MKEPKLKIKDNPTLAELRKNVNQIEALVKVIRFFEKFGRKNKKHTKGAEDFLELKKEINLTVHIPDKFNEHFSDYGWVASESLSLPLMQEAINLAEKKGTEVAEEILVDEFSSENIHFKLRRLYNIEKFKIRRDLMEKVFLDYTCGRYHSVVPVLLATIDGFVNDVRQTGFFADGIDLEAWDSVSGHSTGITKLRDIFNGSRKKTSAETIKIPYRHGILHGRDLGYDNKYVAAKTWAALFAVADWVRALEKNIDMPIEEKEPNLDLIEAIKKYQDIQAEKKAISEWMPRIVTIGKNCPVSGEVDDYCRGTPERTVVCFLHHWKHNRYGKIVTKLKYYRDISINKEAGVLKNKLSKFKVSGFQVISVEHDAGATANISIALSFLQDGVEKTEKLDFRLVYENKGGTPQLYPWSGAKWRIIMSDLENVEYLF